MVWVELPINMVKYIMDHLKMIKKMGLEWKSIIMGKYMRGNGKMEKNMESVSLCIQILMFNIDFIKKAIWSKF